MPKEAAHIVISGDDVQPEDVRKHIDAFKNRVQATPAQTGQVTTTPKASDGPGDPQSRKTGTLNATDYLGLVGLALIVGGVMRIDFNIGLILLGIELVFVAWMMAL